MAELNEGIVCLYGIGTGQEASLFVQGYSVSSSFNNTGTVVDEQGVTRTARYDDRKSEITVDGVAKATSVPQLGASFSFTAKTASAYPGGSASVSFVGVVTKVDDKGSSQGFVSVSITAESYEGISTY
jgi:uncharacterized protein YbbC (DUF1343 family)